MVVLDGSEIPFARNASTRLAPGQRRRGFASVQFWQSCQDVSPAPAPMPLAAAEDRGRVVREGENERRAGLAAVWHLQER